MLQRENVTNSSSLTQILIATLSLLYKPISFLVLTKYLKMKSCVDGLSRLLIKCWGIGEREHECESTLRIAEALTVIARTAMDPCRSARCRRWSSSRLIYWSDLSQEFDKFAINCQLRKSSAVPNRTATPSTSSDKPHWSPRYSLCLCASRSSWWGCCRRGWTCDWWRSLCWSDWSDIRTSRSSRLFSNISWGRNNFP